MSALLNDHKFKADVLTGYDALAKVLHYLERGAKIQDWNPDEGQMVDVDEDGMPKVLEDLQLLRTTLRSLIVGAHLPENNP